MVFSNGRRFMRRTIGRSLLAAFAVAASLTGCSAGPLSDASVSIGEKLKSMPESLGGLPPDTPKGPAVPYAYPPVHDMPPPRSTEPLSEDQQYRLEKELSAVRDRQEAANPATQKAAEAAKKVPKKKPAPASKGQSAGATAGTNAGAKTNP
jgi:hypothetical protein